MIASLAEAQIIGAARLNGFLGSTTVEPFAAWFIPVIHDGRTPAACEGALGSTLPPEPSASPNTRVMA